MGFLDKLLGRGKKAAGDMTGDESMRSEGAHQEAAGAAEDRAASAEQTAQELGRVFVRESLGPVELGRAIQVDEHRQPPASAGEGELDEDGEDDVEIADSHRMDASWAARAKGFGSEGSRTNNSRKIANGHGRRCLRRVVQKLPDTPTA